MFEFLLVLAGLFIGWNFPQPPWAKYVQAKVAGWFNKTEDSA